MVVVAEAVEVAEEPLVAVEVAEAEEAARGLRVVPKLSL